MLHNLPTRPLLTFICVTLSIGFFASNALAEDEIKASNTALVVVNPQATSEHINKFLDDSILKPQWNNDESKDFSIVNLPPDEARAHIQEKYGMDFAHVEANPAYQFFPSGCGTPMSLPNPDDTYPGDGVVIMEGPLRVPSDMTTRKAWIVDTGIDISNPLLNIEFTDAALCDDKKCTSAAADHTLVMDGVGHGTFIAGIIGGRPHPDDATGSVLGMLPNAKVVPIKVEFSPGDDARNASTAINALNWVFAKATAGDVVNISWGATLDPANAGDPYSVAEKAIRKLADKGVNVSIAAGNFDPANGELAMTGGYVELVTPARMGGYRSASGGGAIVTSSAINLAEAFWWVTGENPFGSVFGNGLRPDYAAPGANVISHWPGNKLNTCSGTSFAAAHISGALLQKNTIVLKAKKPATGDVDGVQDNIAQCDNSSVKCDITP